MKDAREIMQQWARWRKCRITAGIGWPRKSMLGRMMDGMPGTNCPTCQGRGKNQEFETCPTCSGEGRVKLDPGGKKVNPAFIPSTYRLPDDPQSEDVDHLICELRAADKTYKYFYVLWAEYVKPNGTQDIKARRMNMSHGYYRYLLHEAHKLVELGLENVSNKSLKALTK